VQVNTAKGPWRLLDMLEAPLPAAAPHAAFLQPLTASGQSAAAAAVGPAPPTPASAAVAGRPAMSLDAVRRAVRDVAADIAGDDVFEGEPQHGGRGGTPPAPPACLRQPRGVWVHR